MNIITSNNNIINAVELLLHYVSFKNDYEITFTKSDCFKILKKENKVEIIYSKINEIYYGLGQVEIGNFNVNSCPFKHVGVMIDNARNGVSNLDSLKEMIVNLALLGYNFLGLYLEDCFEVDNEPFFGYNRGRYTQKEIKEVDEFANLFGIELIPYIQTLAHLNRIFNHYLQYTAKVHDMHDVLLMDEPRTYELIENYISSVRKCFSSNHLHVGLDESFVMTEGKYKALHQEFKKEEVFFNHVNKVIDIAKKYDFEVEAWGDMFYKHLLGKKLPEDLTISCWSYYLKEKEEVDNLLNDYKKLTNNISFASSSHRYFGFIPFNEYAASTIKVSMQSCIENKIDRYVITLWGDDGAECGVFQTLPSLIRSSSYMYNNENHDKMSKLLTNYSYDELLLLDSPNHVFDGTFDRIVNPSRYLFYKDVFYGLDDKPENPIYINYFIKYQKQIKPLLNRHSKYAYLFDFTYKLLNVLISKNCLRNRLIKANMTNNIKELKLIKKQLIQLNKNNIEFYKVNEKKWLKECKPFGLEVLQIRLSGVISRIDYVIKEVTKKIKDNNYVIIELTEMNLEPQPINDKYNGAGIYNRYSQNVTSCTLATNDYIG